MKPPFTTQQTDRRHRMIWFYEGLDKSGKTTLAQRCQKECTTVCPCAMYDRGTVSREVFWHFNHEVDFPIEERLAVEKALTDLGIYGIVWCRALPETCLHRETEAGEVAADQASQELRLRQLREHDCLFQRLIAMRERQGVPVVEVWTDRSEIGGTIENILTAISGGRWARRV